MKRDINVLNKMYKVVDMGIIGIEEVIKKVDDSCLEKVMLDQKKEYLVIRGDLKTLMDEYEEDPKGISPAARISNDIYTNIKLIGNENNQEIAKMMLEGTNRGIMDVTKIKNEQNFKNEAIMPIIDHLLDTLEYNERELKKYL